MQHGAIGATGRCAAAVPARSCEQPNTSISDAQRREGNCSRQAAGCRCRWRRPRRGAVAAEQPVAGVRPVLTSAAAASAYGPVLAAALLPAAPLPVSTRAAVTPAPSAAQKVAASACILHPFCSSKHNMVLGLWAPVLTSCMAPGQDRSHLEAGSPGAAGRSVKLAPCCEVAVQSFLRHFWPVCLPTGQGACARHDAESRGQTHRLGAPGVIVLWTVRCCQAGRGEGHRRAATPPGHAITA